MDDWDILFLQAAGKSSSKTSKRSLPTSTIADGIESSQEASANQSEKIKRHKKLRRSGIASKCLKSCGFKFSVSAAYDSGNSFPAAYEIVDCWEVGEKELTSVQIAVRKLFLVVRNSRAVGFTPCQKSLTPICQAYMNAMKNVLDSLNDMQSLAARFSELVLTRSHIQDAIDAVKLMLSKRVGIDFKDETVDSAKSSKEQVRHKKCIQRIRVTILQLISSLDTIYGELLVAAIDTGTSLPDPRLYLESLCGSVENCVMSHSKSISSGTEKRAVQCSANPLLRYLELRTIEASALNLSLLSRAAAELEGLSVGADEGTMRGSDPLSCHTVRAWWHAARNRVAPWAAFACPSEQAIAALKSFSEQNGVIEMGAGVGYWALILRNAGVDVLAYDKQPSSTSADRTSQSHRGAGKKLLSGNEYHGRFDSWSEVLYGDATTPCDTDRVLLLCYPPPDDPMAVRTLRGFTGSQLAYVGEFQGDTGTAEFEALLAAHWNLVQDPIPLPNFGNTCYSLTLWRRREKAGKSPSPSPTLYQTHKCVGCRDTAVLKEARTLSIFYRDRLTRAVWACSLECARTESARRSLREEMALRHIGYGMSEEAANDDNLWRKSKS
jgi:hypothetical protein